MKIFEIELVYAKSITVTSPHGKEKWRAGSTYDIKWNYSTIDNVDIEYSTDVGANWTVVENSVNASDGAYSWTVPDIPSANCLVKITDSSDPNITDQSDDVFTILPPASITVTSPDGGEISTAGTTYDITWNYITTDQVDIKYSTDGGTNWTKIKDRVKASDGAYSWTVPDTPSANCLVKIWDRKDHNVTDQSDGVFTIN